METELKTEISKPTTPVVCEDFDEDCFPIKNKVWCYESDKTTGQCPFICSK